MVKADDLAKTNPTTDEWFNDQRSGYTKKKYADYIHGMLFEITRAHSLLWL